MGSKHVRSGQGPCVSVKSRLSAAGKGAAAVLLSIVICLLALNPVSVYADTPVLDPDVSEPSSGCVFVGLPGTFYANDQDALDRINEIRWEACTEGNVPDPRDASRMLTEDDYVPIKWSADLERIARIRACEAALTVAHARLNGKSIWTVRSNGIQSWGEVLAWNWSSNMVNGVNQFYREKADWVNQNSDAVTGHYTQMIDPDHTYVGMGCFCSSETPYYNSTAGQFSGSYYGAMDETMLSSPGEVIQKLEVSVSNLSGYTISADHSELEPGESEELKLSAGVSYNGYTTRLDMLEGAVFESSDSSVISVSSKGVMTALKNGSAVISATVGGAEAASIPVTVTGGETPLQIITQPESVSGKTGDRVTLTVEAEGDDLTYQWYVRASETAEWKASKCKAASNSTTLTASANGRQLYVVVTDKYGNSVQSDVATLTVVPVLKITEQPQNITGNIGDKVSLKVTAEGEGLTYQWYVRASESAAWKKSSRTTATNETTLTASANGRQLYVAVTDKYGNTVKSDIATLTVVPALKITQQPEDVSGAVGDKVTLQVTAEGDGLTYQWFVRDNESASWKKSSRTTATNSTKLSASSEGRQLYVEVTDKYGNTVKSDVATLHVTSSGPKITKQPEDVTGTIGQKITLKVAAEGEGLTYQWYVRDSAGGSWRKSSCTKASNSTKLNTAADGRQLYVVVTDSSGKSVESRIATLHVTK